ncbi:MAG TPA: hypothetical protein VNI01_02740, partial [Elusimicrobiota bacterium]|nr:hypothetical protein [Elusimicrobiota bacterium]
AMAANIRPVDAVVVRGSAPGAIAPALPAGLPDLAGGKLELAAASAAAPVPAELASPAAAPDPVPAEAIAAQAPASAEAAPVVSNGEGPANGGRPAPEPSYRGVPRDRVVDSLKRAETFLRKLDLGPATAGMLDAWLEQRPYDLVAAAQDDAALAGKMRQVGHGFNRSYELFRHHAALDAEAAALHRDLSAWGGFGMAESADYRTIDAERQAHLLASYARIARERPPGPERLREAAAPFGEGASWLEKGIPFAVGAWVQGRARLERFFNRLPLHMRHVLVEALRRATGMAELEDGLAVDAPMGRYGVVVEGLPRNFGEMRAVMAPILERAGAALEPFYETDEVGMTGIGVINDAQDGFIFEGTRRAAQALADAMPDRVVVDFRGRRIAPRQTIS